MNQPYQINQTIQNLQALRQEKQKLRQHIRQSDRQLKQDIYDLPALAIFRTAKEVGAYFTKGLQHSSLSTLLNSKPDGKTHIWSELIKSIAMVAASQLVKKWMANRKNKKQQPKENEAALD